MSAMHVISRCRPALWLLLLLLGAGMGGVWADSFDEGGSKPVAVPLAWGQTDIEPVINHASRVHRRPSRGFGARGYEQYYYRGDAEVLNDVLRQFAATELPARELVLRPGAAKACLPVFTGSPVPGCGSGSRISSPFKLAEGRGNRPTSRGSESNPPDHRSLPAPAGISAGTAERSRVEFRCQPSG